MGTRSIVALKAFLQGEQHFRRGALDSAIANYGRAVRLDSTFALALRRLALAHGWKGGHYAELGRPFLPGRPIRPRAFPTGQSPGGSGFAPGGIGRHPARLDNAVTAGDAALPVPRGGHPELSGDPEVWYQLGEAREHYGAEVGATLAQEMDAFDHSIALDSTFAEAYVHPIFRTLDRGDCGRALGYLRPAGATCTSRPTSACRARRRLVLARLLDGTAGRRAGIQPILDTLSGRDAQGRHLDAPPLPRPGRDGHLARCGSS